MVTLDDSEPGKMRIVVALGWVEQRWLSTTRPAGMCRGSMRRDAREVRHNTSGAPPLAELSWDGSRLPIASGQTFLPVCC